MRYGNMILIGDFNVKTNEANMQNFLNLYNLKSLIQEKTCFKKQITHPALTSSLENALKAIKTLAILVRVCRSFIK